MICNPKLKNPEVHHPKAGVKLVVPAYMTVSADGDRVELSAQAQAASAEILGTTGAKMPPPPPYVPGQGRTLPPKAEGSREVGWLTLAMFAGAIAALAVVLCRMGR